MRQEENFDPQLAELMDRFEQYLGHRYRGVSGIVPEWGKLQDVMKLTSLGRARIYEIMSEEPGALQTFVLKRPGAKSGARLFQFGKRAQVHGRALRESTITQIKEFRMPSRAVCGSLDHPPRWGLETLKLNWQTRREKYRSVE